MPKPKVVAAALIALFVAMHGRGQQTPPETTPSAEDPFLVRTSIVVTATRSEIDTSKAAAATSIVGRKEMELRNSQSLDQTLTAIPGLYAYRSKGPADTLSKVVTRGFAGANRTLVLLDGHPLNDAYLGEVSWTSLPIQEMERVEAVRGAFSSLYGGNAMGGVINILTRPITSRELEASIQRGTYATTNYGVRFSDRFFNRLGISLGYQRLQTAGYDSRFVTTTATTGSTGTLVTGPTPNLTSTGSPTWIIGTGGSNWYNQHAYRLKGEYAFTPSTLVTIQYIRQNYGYGYYAFSTALRDAAGQPFSSGTATFDAAGVMRRITISPATFLSGPGGSVSHFVAGSLYHKLTSRRTVRISGSTYRQPDNWFSTPGSSATTAGGAGTTSVRESGSEHAEAQFNWQVSSSHDLVFGSDTRRDRSLNREYELGNYSQRDTAGRQTYESTGRSLTYGLYVQDRITLTDKVQIVAGGRYDYWKTYDGRSNSFAAAAPLTEYAERTTNSINGKVASVYTGPAGFTLRASVGTAFRNPTNYELYRTWRSASGITYNANPALASERLLAWEAGARKTLGAHTDLEAAYFENRVDNLIYRKTDLVSDPAGRVRIYVNAGEGRTRGVEFSTQQRMRSWLLLRGAYTFTNAVIARNPALPETEGKMVPGIPEHMGTMQLMASRSRWSGLLGARYVGATFNLDNNADKVHGVPGAYDSFFLLEASGSFNVHRHVQVIVSADNLLDRTYYLFYRAPGRTVSAGLRFRL